MVPLGSTCALAACVVSAHSGAGDVSVAASAVRSRSSLGLAVPAAAQARRAREPACARRVRSPAARRDPGCLAVQRDLSQLLTPVSAVWPGRFYLLGVMWDGEGVNFALFSEHAERVELCLFDPSGRREIQRLAPRE